MGLRRIALFLIGYVVGDILGEIVWTYWLKPALEEWEWRHDG